MDKINEHFGKWVQNKRSQNGWSVRFLSDMAQINNKNLYNIENGVTLSPRLDSIIRIVKALGYSLSQCFKELEIQADNNFVSYTFTITELEKAVETEKSKKLFTKTMENLKEKRRR